MLQADALLKCRYTILDGTEYAAAIGEEDPACGSKKDPVALALKEGRAQFVLQLGNGLAQRRLGQVKMFCGKREAATFRDGTKIAKLHEFHL